jgi:hypothetical protein
MIILNLTRAQVSGSPPVDIRMPFSRSEESEFCRFYGYPEYWPYTTYWPWGAVPTASSDVNAAGRGGPRAAPESERRAAQGHDHLHSSRTVTGYRVEARESSLGSVEDLLFDERTWAIRHIVVATRSWLPGRRVRVAPEWIRSISWPERCFVVGLTREDMRRGDFGRRKHSTSW